MKEEIAIDRRQSRNQHFHWQDLRSVPALQPSQTLYCVLMYRRYRGVCSLDAQSSALFLFRLCNRIRNLAPLRDCATEEDVAENDDLKVPESPPHPRFCKRVPPVLAGRLVIQLKVNGHGL